MPDCASTCCFHHTSSSLIRMWKYIAIISPMRAVQPTEHCTSCYRTLSANLGGTPALHGLLPPKASCFQFSTIVKHMAVQAASAGHYSAALESRTQSVTRSHCYHSEVQVCRPNIAGCSTSTSYRVETLLFVHLAKLTAHSLLTGVGSRAAHQAEVLLNCSYRSISH